MTSKVTIKTIAEELGISHMTVSRAFSDHPNVSAKTKQLILKRADELGYVRNAAAAAMRGKQTSIAGLILPNIVNDFYAQFASDFETACAKAGISLLVHITQDDPVREEQAIIRLTELRAASVVIVPTPGASKLSNKLLKHFNVVQLIREQADQSATATLTVNDHDAIAEAVRRLYDQGLMRVAYVGASRSLSSGAKRYAAFETAINDLGLNSAPSHILTDGQTYAFGREAVDTLLALAERPQAIVCGGFEISRGVLDRLLENGLEMPSDMALIGYGDPSHYRWVAGGVSTIALPITALAKAAAAALSPTRTTPTENRKEAVAELIIRSTA